MVSMDDRRRRSHLLDDEDELEDDSVFNVLLIQLIKL